MEITTVAVLLVGIGLMVLAGRIRQKGSRTRSSAARTIRGRSSVQEHDSRPGSEG